MWFIYARFLELRAGGVRAGVGQTIFGKYDDNLK